ncbi:hypothetical protein [Halomicrococcus sp. SG-WS-1]|uniref:hypothetical protein n=1 Tax=Halomicrococcus sp. SG-WS-1 TaxID=3439057 RepID=UPI003F798A50
MTGATDGPDRTRVEGEAERSGPVDVPERDDPTDVPDWDDEYVDRVSDRLLTNYDLEKDVRVRGESFDLYGRLVMENQKQFLHRALNYANHSAEEHLFVRRVDAVGVADLRSLVDLGHDLAEEWIEPSERHYGTEFTFALVAPSLPDAVREFVDGFRDRTLLKYGYYGRYEVNLVVVAPDDEAIVASTNADVSRAFALWNSVDADGPGLLARVAGRLRP